MGEMTRILAGVIFDAIDGHWRQALCRLTLELVKPVAASRQWAGRQCGQCDSRWHVTNRDYSDVLDLTTTTLSNPSNSAVARRCWAHEIPQTAISVTVEGTSAFPLTTGIDNGNPLYSNFAVQPIATSGPNAGMLGALSATQTTNVLKLMFDYAAQGNLTNPSGSSSTLNDALGAAIWEVTDGKGTDSPNAFVVNGGANDIKIQARGATGSSTITAAVNLANSWLAGLATQTQEENPADVFALVGFDQYGNPLQTQAIVLCPPPVPEPGTAVGLASLSLMGLVATCLTFVRRNRKGLRECEGDRRVSELAQNIA